MKLKFNKQINTAREMHNQAGAKRCHFYTYCNNPKCWGRQAWTKSVDLDQMPQNMWLLICIYTVYHSISNIKDVVKQDLFKF